MPRGKPNKPAPRDEFFEEPTTAELDIEEFLTEWAPQTSVVEIYRRREDGSQPHIKRVGIDILKADLYGYLRDKFGNGKFILQFKDQARRIVKQLTVDVEGAEIPNAPHVPGNGNGATNGTFLEQLLLTMIASNKPPPPPPPFDMVGLAALLAALKPAPSSDPAAMLAAMSQTFKELKPDGDNVDKALTLISKAKDIAGDGGGSNGDSWPSLIKDGLAAVGQVLKPNAPDMRTPPLNAGGIPPGAVPYVPSGVPLVSSGDVPYITREPGPVVDTRLPLPENPDVIMQKWLTAQISFLKQKAKGNKDVDYWVEYIFENQEEPGCNAILTALERGATFQDLLTFDPEISKDPILSPWFQKLYETLHAELNKDMDSPGAGGHAPNPGGNEEPSPQG